MSLPSEMTAIVLYNTGDSPDFIQEVKLQVPTPGPNQILIKASSIQ